MASQVFPIEVPDAESEYPIEDLSEHIEAVFCQLRGLGVDVFVWGEDETDSGIEVRVTDIDGNMTTFILLNQDEMYPLDIEKEEVNSVEEYLDWIARHAEDYFSGPVFVFDGKNGLQVTLSIGHGTIRV